MAEGQTLALPHRGPSGTRENLVLIFCDVYKHGATKKGSLIARELSCIDCMIPRGVLLGANTTGRSEGGIYAWRFVDSRSIIHRYAFRPSTCLFENIPQSSHGKLTDLAYAQGHQVADPARSALGQIGRKIVTLNPCHGPDSRRFRSVCRRGCCVHLHHLQPDRCARGKREVKTGRGGQPLAVSSGYFVAPKLSAQNMSQQQQ